MLYVIGLLITISKGFMFILNKDLLPYLCEQNIQVIVLLILVNIVINKIYRYKRRHNNLTEHIIYYRFNNKRSLYYSFFIVTIVFFSYLSTVIYLRIVNLYKPIDLAQIYFYTELIYHKTTMLLCIYIFSVIIMIIYILLKIIMLLKRYINIHLSKLHFYFLSYQRYKDIHNFFRDYLNIEQLFISPIRRCIHYIEIVVCFGYYKEICYQYLSDSIKDKSNKKLFWTEEEIIKYDEFQIRHQLTSTTLYYILSYITKCLYKLHIILLLMIFIYDSYYNNYILINTTYALPFLFVYQIYISVCIFINDKPTYDICEIINTFYYKDVVVLDEKAIKINGEIFEMPNNFVKDFLTYESNGFSRKKIT